MKKENKIRVFRYLLKNSGQTNMAVAGALGLSFPTVNQNIKELQQEGLVLEEGKSGPTGGRTARMVSAVSDARIAFGLDLSANHISLVAIDLSGKILAKQRVREAFAKTENYYRKLGRLCKDMAEQLNLEEEQILGIGLSVPAIVDASGRCIRNSYTLDCRNFPIEEIEDFLPWKGRFIRDATAGGLAEARCRQEESNLFYLSLNNTIGGAIYVNSALYQGDTGKSGEIGHMILVPGGRPCYCGKSGCMNMYCSPQLLSELTSGSLEQFFEQVERGDEKCRARLEEYLFYLATAVNSIHMLYDCDVVLGGYLGGMAPRYIEQLRDKAAKLNPNEQETDYIRPCSYTTEASAVGAALLFTEDFIENI